MRAAGHLVPGPGLDVSGGTTATTPSATSPATADDRSSTVPGPSGSNCFGPPKRCPAPAATTIAHTAPGTPGEGSTLARAMAHEDVLAATDLFHGVTPEDLTELARHASTRRLVRGDVLFNEGDPPERCSSCCADAVAIANQSFDGRESVVALMENGDLFGEMGMLDGLPRSAEARALEPSEVLALAYGPVTRAARSATRAAVGRRADAGRPPAGDGRGAGRLGLPRRDRTHGQAAAGAGQRGRRVPAPGDAGGAGGHGRRVRERVNKAIASFIRLGWIEQSDRRYRILQRDRLELRAR